MNPREILANRLLQLLPPGEVAKLIVPSEVLDMPVRHTVFEPNQPGQYVYFPLSGVVSMHIRMRESMSVEIATIGREGMVGVEIFLGGQQTHAAAFVLLAARALRIGSEAFREIVQQSVPLTTLLLRYTHAVLAQVAQSAACNRVHSVEERCARWLLMTHDRVDGDRFDITQEFLAEILGVRRPSVSIAASVLQRAGFIRYSRGRVEVVDRAGLESASCECHAVIAGEYERLIGTPS